MSAFPLVPAPVPAAPPQEFLPYAPPSPDDLHAFADLLRRFPGLIDLFAPAAGAPADPRDLVTVGQLIDKYLSIAKDDICQRVYEERCCKLTAFKDRFGDRFTSDLSPLDLKAFIADNKGRWKSGWTRQGVIIAIQRVFNWGVGNRIIRENPLKGAVSAASIDMGEKITGRDMTEQEFQCVLRWSDPWFRKFLMFLKMTGCRPGEASAITWENVVWEQGIVILDQHKTRKKTGKPRIIVLPPAVLKMLIIIRRDYNGPAAVELKRMLEGAPNRTLPSKEVTYRMQQMGFSLRKIYTAAKLIGVTKPRKGGWAEHGHVFYVLPEDAVARPLPPISDRVFLNSKGRPWKREAIDTKFYRIRQETSLPPDCKLYSLRHFFITSGVKRNVNLKALAELVGHNSLAMIDRVYTHLNRDVAFLHNAAAGVLGLKGTPMPLPLPVDTKAWTDLLRTVYPPAPIRPARKQYRREPGGPLRDGEKMAYRLYLFAVKECPELAKGTDRDVYEWLEKRPEFKDQLPPNGLTFRRYMNRARQFYLGMGKRKARRAEAESLPLPEAPPAAEDEAKGGAA